MKLKCGLSKLDCEFAVQELEVAEEALQNVLMILGRRRIRKGELYPMIPLQNSLADMLWKFFMLDSGRNEGPRWRRAGRSAGAGRRVPR